MIDRLVLGVVFGVAGISGLLPPDPPKPLTAQQLRIKARDDSIARCATARIKRARKLKRSAADGRNDRPDAVEWNHRQ